MSVIAIKREHNNGLEAAKHEAELLAQKLSDKFGASYHWDDDKVMFKGKGAKGYVHCMEQCLDMRLELGFMLRPFKGKIEQEIHKYLDSFCAQ